MPCERGISPGFFTTHVGGDADQRLDVMGDLARSRVVGCGVDPGLRFGFDGQVIKAAVALDDELVVRRDVGQADEHRFHLRRIHVDAADDQHVVVAPRDAQDAQVRPPAIARRGRDLGDVACPVTQHRQRFLGECSDHQLARLALAHRTAALGVDHFEQEVVLPAVQSSLALAFAGDSGPHDFRQSVDVDRLEAQSRLDLAPHRVAPRLGAEHADVERAFGQVDTLFFRKLGNRQRVRRCRAENACAEIQDQCNLPLRRPARHRHDGGTEPLGAVMRPQAAGEQPIAVCVVNQVSGPRAAAGERARHQIGPGAEVGCGVTDHGGFASRSR